jgi:hypothetical protein
MGNHTSHKTQTLSETKPQFSDMCQAKQSDRVLLIYEAENSKVEEPKCAKYNLISYGDVEFDDIAFRRVLPEAGCFQWQDEEVAIHFPAK